MKKFEKASQVKVGVVGYGAAYNISRSHLNEMTDAGMTPVAVAEPDAERRKVAEEEFPGIKTYASLKTMLAKSDVNLVTVNTPHNTHAKLALTALKSGRHVVCEKPLAITTAECDAMIAAAKQSKVMLSTYHNRHWDGHILAAVKHIKSGMIGDIVHIDVHLGGRGKPGDEWRSSRRISGGILYDWGVHLLEYSLQLIDSDIVEVSGFAHTGFWGPDTKWKNDCIEDEATAIVRFKNGSRLGLQISNIETNPRPGLITITGTTGSYVIDWGANTHHSVVDGNSTIVKYPNPGGEGWRFYQNVADHLVKGKKLVITPEWARRPIHILDLAAKSAKKNTTIKATYK
jgi:scyllo-inositol 2-dehydrogenase (NADP+)